MAAAATIMELATMVQSIRERIEAERQAKRALKERFTQVERMAVRTAALQRVAMLAAEGLPYEHLKPQSRASFVSKPFGYAQETAYQSLVMRLRKGPHALALLLMCTPESSKLPSQQVDALGTVCWAN
jgi:hypothetical protein